MLAASVFPWGWDQEKKEEKILAIKLSQKNQTCMLIVYSVVKFCKLSHQTCSVPQAPDFIFVPWIVNFLPHNVDGCDELCNW